MHAVIQAGYDLATDIAVVLAGTDGIESIHCIPALWSTDCVFKLFSPRETMARVQAALRSRDEPTEIYLPRASVWLPDAPAE